MEKKKKTKKDYRLRYSLSLDVTSLIEDCASPEDALDRLKSLSPEDLADLLTYTDSFIGSAELSDISVEDTERADAYLRVRVSSLSFFPEDVPHLRKAPQDETIEINAYNPGGDISDDDVYQAANDAIWDIYGAIPESFDCTVLETL